VRSHQDADAHSLHYGAFDRLGGVALYHHVRDNAERFDVLKQVQCRGAAATAGRFMDDQGPACDIPQAPTALFSGQSMTRRLCGPFFL
jgi:hypothetical protein